MKTSIGVQSDTKDALAQAKPAGLAWDDFLRVMRASVDEKKYRRNLERLLGELEAESVDAAIARVKALRSGKEAALGLAEAKARLKRRQLAAQAARFSELLAGEPASEDLRQAARDLDVQLHTAILEG
ncbi:MAG: hypothetical protein QOI20_3428 [Acidimicrobiaceae bacterium]|jgi:hypothetical protein|nr:hypothetical protein [Acidimicrobiaceae bacterium]